MFLTDWRKWLDNLARSAGRGPRRGRHIPGRRRPYRPLLESLEPRWVPSLTTIASFTGSNGANPEAGLVLDGSGNLFGTAINGTSNLGTVFEVAHGNNLITTLASFDGANGANPETGLVRDASGNLFGTTTAGGAANMGTVFEVVQGSNIVITLASFDGANGAEPRFGALVRDGSGNLFGTTSFGGAANMGTVFEVAQGSNSITTLASFDGNNGATPEGALALDASGNLFGTTTAGGADNAGTVFELTPQAGGTYALTTLAAFNISNGDLPRGDLVLDAGGNLYGTTQVGGASEDGTVFELTPQAGGAYTLTTLASFTGANGALPFSGMVLDGSGNLFGTTFRGGASNLGTVFEVAQGSNSITTLASFDGTNGDAANPVGRLVRDGSGNLFGTAQNGGSSGLGAVFEVSFSADLSVTVSAPPTTPETRPITYTISVTNHGPTDDTNVTLTDPVLAGATFVSSSFDGYDPMTGKVHLGTVAANTSVGGTIVIRVPDEGTYTNQAAVAGDLTDPDLSNNSQTAQATVTEADDLAPAASQPAVALTEGQPPSSPVPVATFTDTVFPGNPASDFTATIDWGDGTGVEPAGSIGSDGAGNFTVYGSHTYAEDGSYTIKTTLADDAPGTAAATATGSAAVSEGNFTLHLIGNRSESEGQALNGFEVATFEDPGSPDDPGAFSATIAWGDGTSSPGTIMGSGGSFTVTGNHTYLDEGTYAYQVSLSEPEGNFSVLIPPSVPGGTFDNMVTVAEADTLAPVEVTTGRVQENQILQGTGAIFRDTGYPDNDPADFSATFDWGDGTTYSTDAGNVRVTSDGAGDFTLTVSSHTYVDEGTYTVVATLADGGDGTVTASQVGTLTAAETDTLVAVSTQPSPTVQEGDGTASNEVAVFRDTGYPNNAPADFTATIDWGDGTSGPGTVSTAGDGQFTVSGSHAYTEDGTYTVATTLADDAPGTAVATATTAADVTESPLTVSGTSVATTEGTTFSGTVATFTDGNPLEPTSDHTAEIVWGDGSSSAGTITQPGGRGTPFQVLGSHAYAEEGAYTATVLVTDDPSGSAMTFTGSAAVSVANASLSVTGTAVSATEGQTFTGQVATVTDGGGAEATTDYSASIDWGDGTTTAGTVINTGGSLTVTGSHAYSEEGTYTTTVTVTDDPGSPLAVSASASVTANVADAPLTAQGVALPAQQATTFSGTVANFTDADPNGVVGDYSATINWGDGTTTTGTVGGSAAGGGFQVSGQHAYLQAGNYSVKVVIHDQGGSAATASSSASVAAAPFTLTAFPQQGFEGLPMNNVLLATFGHGGGAEPAALFTAGVSWGDGTVSSASVTQGSDGAYSVTASHTYLDEPALGLIVPNTRLFPITVSVGDASSASSAQTVGIVLEPLPSGSTGVTPLTPNGTANGRYAAELFNDLTGDRISAALVNRWVTFLRHHGRRTLVTSLLTDSLLRSLHVRAVQAGGGSSSAALVEGYYRLFLDRSADPSGLSTGVRKLRQAGESALVAFLLSSDEYVSKTVLGGG